MLAEGVNEAADQQDEVLERWRGEDVPELTEQDAEACW